MHPQALKGKHSGPRFVPACHKIKPPVVMTAEKRHRAAQHLHALRDRWNPSRTSLYNQAVIMKGGREQALAQARRTVAVPGQRETTYLPQPRG